MTNMAAVPIYAKNPQKIFFSRTKRPMTLKLNMKHCLCKYYQTCSNYDPGLTLTHFTPRSGLVTLWGFCMYKSENYLFFGNYCSLGSQSCLKHSAKWVNEVEWVSKYHSLTLVKGHSDFKVRCLTFGLYTQVSHSGSKALLFRYKNRKVWKIPKFDLTLSCLYGEN